MASSTVLTPFSSENVAQTSLSATRHTDKNVCATNRSPIFIVPGEHHAHENSPKIVAGLFIEQTGERPTKSRKKAEKTGGIA
jgi:hypothetical protein